MLAGENSAFWPVFHHVVGKMAQEKELRHETFIIINPDLQPFVKFIK